MAKKKVSKKKAARGKTGRKRSKRGVPEKAGGVLGISSTSFLEEDDMSSFAAYDGGQSERGAIAATGTKRALCIGIDDYPNPRDRLGGCVSDARNWGDWFRGQGFGVETLIDARATHSGIVNAIGRFIRESQPGHIVAIQYSGHGTQLPDLEGEERDKQDEALVPYDHRQNGYILDDDLAALCSEIPTDVNVTFLMDCCHSGTMTRLFIGRSSAAGDVRIRFLAPDEEMLEAHRRSRQRATASRAFASSYRGHKEILMSACRADQTAKERGGQGDFTRYALTALRQGIGGVTNAEFIDRVRVIGSWQDQRPQLWSDSQFYNQPFLGARERGGLVDHHDPIRSELSETLADLESAVRRLRSQLTG